MILHKIGMYLWSIS